jgi:hypothetical protein
MAAPTVYQGVNGKYEGTLFNGIKFWLSQRVPSRSHVLASITASCALSPYLCPSL